MNKSIHTRKATLHAETFGDTNNPTILLIMGAGGPGCRWEDGFCEELAAQGRFVIRYDHRDSGQSTSYPAGKPGYTMDDLIKDPLAILDAFDIKKAHIIGISLGGMIAQLLALKHADRVASVTLVATTPSAPGHDDPDLPQMSKKFLAHVRTTKAPDWNDKQATIDFIIDRERICAGDSRYFDKVNLQKLWGKIYDQTKNFESMMRNHFMAVHPAPWRSQLAQIKVPTLVIHGTEDPVMPFGHGKALAREIPHAQLLAIEAMGHEVLPAKTWPIVIPAIIKHTQ